MDTFVEIERTSSWIHCHCFPDITIRFHWIKRPHCRTPEAAEWKMHRAAHIHPWRCSSFLGK
jgi:hypothetical protein